MPDLGSEPVSASLLEGRGGGSEGGLGGGCAADGEVEEGFGVVEARDGSARGMVLTSRSCERGRVFSRRGFWSDGGRGKGVSEEGEGRGCGGASPVCLAFSSQAARAEGSMGHEEGGSSLSGILWKECFSVIR